MAGFKYLFSPLKLGTHASVRHRLSQPLRMTDARWCTRRSCDRDSRSRCPHALSTLRDVTKRLPDWLLLGLPCIVIEMQLCFCFYACIFSSRKVTISQYLFIYWQTRSIVSLLVRSVVGWLVGWLVIWLVGWMVRSFVRSFVCSFVCLFVCSFVHLFVRLFIRLILLEWIETRIHHW